MNPVVADTFRKNLGELKREGFLHHGYSDALLTELEASNRLTERLEVKKMMRDSSLHRLGVRKPEPEMSGAAAPVLIGTAPMPMPMPMPTRTKCQHDCCQNLRTKPVGVDDESTFSDCLSPLPAPRLW